MAHKGYIYKGKKTVYWCPHCETALAEAEIEYADQKTPTIYVKIPLVDAKDKAPEGAQGKKTSMVILDDDTVDHPGKCRCYGQS